MLGTVPPAGHREMKGIALSIRSVQSRETDKSKCMCCIESRGYFNVHGNEIEKCFVANLFEIPVLYTKMFYKNVRVRGGALA